MKEYVGWQQSQSLTDGMADRQQSESYVVLCFSGTTKMIPYGTFAPLQIHKLLRIYVTRQAKRDLQGGQLSKLIFSHKLVNKLLNDTFINFISS